MGNHAWVNKCGTYGVASAQYYWGRMAALTIRLLYYLMPDILWAFLRADAAPRLSMAIVITMVAVSRRPVAEVRRRAAEMAYEHEQAHPLLAKWITKHLQEVVS